MNDTINSGINLAKCGFLYGANRTIGSKVGFFRTYEVP